MSTKTLRDICADMQQQAELEPYDLGSGDAEDLFVEIWQNLTNGPNSKDIQNAIDKLSEVFGIG